MSTIRERRRAVRMPAAPPAPPTRDLAVRFLDQVEGYRQRCERPVVSSHSAPPCLPEDRTEQVLLIHGTFAGSDDDRGPAWWQVGSETWEELQQRLPPGVRLTRDGEVFHWSGENSERARIKAGQDLLERLLEFESRGEGYHLIGHSHGGSVIWHALRLATLQKTTLTHLRSWSTVGTPFLHYRTRGAWSLANIINLVLALALLKPAYFAFVRFFGFALAAIRGQNATLDLHSDAEVGWLMAVLRSPFLRVLEWAGVSLRTTDAGLRLGNYDPSTGQSLFDYLFLSREGLVVCGVTLLGGYVFLLLSSLFLNPVLESLRIRAEKRLERKIMAAYRERWLGLWSENDEAINGLRATLSLSMSFIAHMTQRDRILLSDHLAIVSRPYFWAFAPVFNHLVRPALDRVVRTLVVKTAQGNNRPAAEVIAVSPYPVAHDHGKLPPPLPTAIDGELLRDANRHARELAPHLRELLAQPAFAAGLERFGHTLSGRELIHTSYFVHPAVLDLLALHLAWGTGAWSFADVASLSPLEACYGELQLHDVDAATCHAQACRLPEAPAEPLRRSA